MIVYEWPHDAYDHERSTPEGDVYRTPSGSEYLTNKRHPRDSDFAGSRAERRKAAHDAKVDRRRERRSTERRT